MDLESREVVRPSQTFHGQGVRDTLLRGGSYSLKLSESISGFWKISGRWKTVGVGQGNLSTWENNPKKEPPELSSAPPAVSEDATPGAWKETHSILWPLASLYLAS